MLPSFKIHLVDRHRICHLQLILGLDSDRKVKAI